MNDCEKLHRIVYISTSKQRLSEADLEDIRSISQKNNSEKNITGILVYGDGNFLQVLEGRKSDIHQLYGNITQDPRHHGCIILQDTVSDYRSFPDWTMGFKEVSNIEFLQLASSWDQKNKHLPLISEETEHFVLEILDVFVEHNR
jgi:hypothetical protein